MKEQDIKNLPIEVRNLITKKVDLESACNREFNRKIGIIKDTELLRGQATILRDKNKKLATANTELEKINKKYIADLTAERRATEKETKKLIEVTDSIDRKRELLEKDSQKIIREKESFKEEKKAFQKEKSNIELLEKTLEKAIFDAEKEKGNFKKLTEGLQKQVQDNTKKESEIFATLDRAKKAQDKAGERLKKLDEENEKLDLREKRLGSIDKALNERSEDLDRKERENDDDSKKNEVDKLSIIRHKDAQDKRDKEIEIKRLRVEKLVREKGVAKELKDLEKSLQ